MSATFTPGPWEIDVPHRPWICTVGNNPGDPAIFGAPTEPGQPFVWGDKQADARLIAAAPDLYEALHDALEVLYASGNAIEQGWVDALAKARGEQ